MNDPGDSEPGSVEALLGGECTLTHGLQPCVGVLSGLKTRADLVRSPVYRTHAQALRTLTFGFEYRCRAEPHVVKPPGDTLRVVAWNIQRGARLEGIVHTLKTEPELAPADVFLLVEADVGMARSGNRNVPRELAKALNCDYVFGVNYFCLTPGNSREEAVTAQNGLALAGNLILSRLPLTRAENFSVSISKDKFESKEKRLGHKKALLVELGLPRGPLALCAVHLDSGASARQRGLQIADVVAKLTQRGLSDHALIGGDFNTTTYDANHLPALLCNLAMKVLRGGFPHAIEHYLYPDRIYEKALFDRLRQAGYRTDGFNALGQGTLRYEVGSQDSEGRVRDFLPKFAVGYLRRKLAPYDGVVGLKVDWFAARGLTALGAGTVPRPRYRGQPVSDHDPIWVELVVR